MTQVPKPVRKSRKSTRPGFQKYRNTKVKHLGYSFASKFEAKIFDHLRQLVMAGELQDLKCQPHVFLTDARIEMIPDFSALETKSGRRIYFEAKGFETSDWRIKLKLWGHYGPAPLRVFKMVAGGFMMAQEVIPKDRVDFSK